MSANDQCDSLSVVLMFECNIVETIGILLLSWWQRNYVIVLDVFLTKV